MQLKCHFILYNNLDMIIMLLTNINTIILVCMYENVTIKALKY